MKIKLIVLSTLLLCGWGPCQPKPVAPPVAPVGPVPSVATVPVNTELNAAKEKIAADQSDKSKMAANAEAITSMNSGQPPGARTEGVKQEAALIKTVAGEPTPEDRAAAAKRAQVVAEGNAQAIATQYASAQVEAKTQKTRADKAESDLATANTALAAVPQQIADAIAKAQVEAQKKSDAAFAAVQKKQADDRVADAESTARKWQLAICYGVGALLLAGGVVVLVAAVNVPMFGPRAGFALMGAGGTLIAVGVAVSAVQTFIDQHPWIVGAGLGTVGLLVVVAVVLIYSNHQHHLASVIATTTTKPTTA